MPPTAKKEDQQREQRKSTEVLTRPEKSLQFNPRSVGVRRGGCHQPKMGERRSTEVLRKKPMS
jgi:hypothetical protein